MQNLEPSAAAKRYFAKFDAKAARRMAKAWSLPRLTTRQVVDSCLLAIYACAVRDVDAPLQFSFPDLVRTREIKTQTGLSYVRLLCNAERALRRRGFKASVFDDVDLDWAKPETREQSFRFIELLPREINPRTIIEVARFSRMDRIDADGLFKLTLCQIMAAAQQGLRKKTVVMGFEGVFYSIWTDEECTVNAAGVSTRDLAASAKAQLEARGFTVRRKNKAPDWGLDISW